MRVWMLELLRSPEQVIEAVLAKVDQANSAVETGKKEATRRHIQRTELSREQVDHGEYYQVAKNFLTVHAKQDLLSCSAGEFAEFITEVVNLESPVHPDEVNLRLRQEAGLDRKTDAFEAAYDAGLRHALRNKQIAQRDGFLYSQVPTDILVRDRSQFGSSRKRIELVAPEEIAAAVRFVITNACGIKDQEIAAATFAQLGLRTVPENARGIVGMYLNDLIKSGLVVSRGNYLYLAEDYQSSSSKFGGVQ